MRDLPFAHVQSRSQLVTPSVIHFQLIYIGWKQGNLAQEIAENGNSAIFRPIRRVLLNSSAVIASRKYGD